MKKHLNNKGYMLVEIILASAIAMMVAYFIIDITIKLKNKNDDLLVKTLVYTDQAIIYNQIAKDLYSSTRTEPITCNDIYNNIKITNNQFKYKDFVNIVSEYATIDGCKCEPENGGKTLKIIIPIKVKQLKNENFDVVLKYTNT